MAYPQKSFAQTTIHAGSLVGRRREAVASKSLLYQLDVLRKTGRYHAFKLRWHPSYNDPPMVWPIPNHLFWDSDVAKWIEGACYILQQERNVPVEHAVKELVEMIASAQQPDGYLNIHYTVVEPGKRFSNLRDFHELYNAGHLIEAALAHEGVFHNQELLTPILKYVDLLCTTFGPAKGQLHGYPGHPEIELALLRLYHHTGESKHLDLARYFLTERGNPKGCEGRHYYDVEAEKRGDDPNKRPAFYPESRSLWYHQAHAPIAEQQTIEGHSVRAMYLLTAAADLVRFDHGVVDQNFEDAVYRLWNNMVERKMYVTGGIGAIKQWEGFGLEYYLPQGTDEGGCYSETCAAIGIMMFAERLLRINLNGKFADIMELCLYNAVLTSMSYDGKRFTYTNQLASSDNDLSCREEWFTCACCPPNMLRLLGQIGGYINTYSSNFDQQSAGITVHLYISSTLSFDVGDGSVELIQESDWPWDGKVKFALRSSIRNVKVKLRIPGWAKSHGLSPDCPNAIHRNGYVEIPAEWLSSNASFTLSIPLEPHFVSSHPFTDQNTLSLARGPVVYCVEDFDNPSLPKDHFKSLQVDPHSRIDERSVRDKISGDHFIGLTVEDGASVIDLDQIKTTPYMDANSIQHALQQSTPIKKLNFVPYYFRANRGGTGQMRVGLRKADTKPTGTPTNGHSR